MSNEKKEKIVVESKELDMAGVNRYQISHALLNKININYDTHPPVRDQSKRYNMIRTKAKELAIVIAALTPETREQSVSLTKLEECMFFANASIARNELGEQ